MLIKEVKIHLIEMEGKRPIRTMFVIPGQLRSQFDRRATPGHEPNQLCFIRVITDTGIEGWSTAFYTWGPARAFAETWLDAFRHELVGADPLDREYIFQKLWFANRFNWLHPWNMSYADVALWDIAGKYARLSVAKLLGAFRDRIPTYVSSGNYPDPERFVEFGLEVKKEGYKGYKLHSRLGPEADIQVARNVREALGDGFTLMHDPVQIYTYPEAVQVGRALEELNYKWLEETAPGVGHYSTQKAVRYPGYSNSGIGMGIRRISPCGDATGSRRSGYCAGRRDRIGRNYGIDEGSACGRSIRSSVRGTRARTNVLLCPCTGAGRDEQLRVF